MTALTIQERKKVNYLVADLELRILTGMRKLIFQYENHYKMTYGEKRAQDLAMAAATLETISKIMDEENIDVSKRKFFENIESVLSKWGTPYLPHSSKRLREKIIELKAEKNRKATMIVNLPRLGNCNKKKYDDKELYSWIIVMRQSGNNYTNAHIVRHLKTICQLTGKSIASESWFNKIFLTDEVKKLTAEGRFGMRGRRAAIYQGYNPTQRAIFAGDAWQADGTRVNMVNWNVDGKAHFLYVVAIRDVMSGTVLGVSFGETESRWMYVNALRMAVQRTGYLPYELIMDRFPGHNTEEWEAIQNRMETEGMSINYTSSATGKAQIERWFGTLQTVFMARSEFYYGEGIKSNRPYAHRSIEQLKDTQKKAKLIGWGFDRACEETEMVFHAYNNTPLNLYSHKYKNIDKSPEQLHTDSDKPHAIKIENTWQTMRMFGLQKKVSIRHNMVQTEIQKVEYLYAVNDIQVILHYTQVLMCYDMSDLGKVWLFSPCGNKFLCEVQEQPRAQMYGPDKDYGVLAANKARNQKIADQKRERLAEIMSHMNPNDMALLMPGYTRKGELEEAETAYLMAENKKGGVIEILNTEANDDDLAPHSAMGTIEDFDVDAYLYSQM